MATKTALISEIGTNYPDNTIGLITPAITRTTSTDFVNSWQQAPQVKIITASTYSVGADDYGQMLLFSNIGGITVGLPAASAAGFSPFNLLFKNNGAGNVVITPAAGTIDGAPTFTLANGQSVWVVSDGTNWRTGLFAVSSGSGVVTPSALTKTDDTNVTLTLTGTPSLALLQPVTITAGWTSTLASSRGGTANGFFTVAGPTSSTKTFTFPNSSQSVACLDLADQTLSGGANVTSAALAVVSNNVTIDCGRCPLQFLTGQQTTPWTITAPAADGSCMVLLTNPASAVVIPTFPGFTVGSNTGDALTTTANNKFTISIWRISGVSGYRVAAHQ